MKKTKGQKMSSKRKSRQNYDEAFKREAVRLVEEEKMSFRRVEQDLGITNGLVRRWQNALHEDDRQPFPGSGYQRAEQAELTRLRREVKVLKQERDILKKATAFFAKNQ